MIADRQTHTDKHTGTIITILHSLIRGGVTNVYSNESVHSGVRELQSCDVNAPIALKVFKTRVHFFRSVQLMWRHSSKSMPTLEASFSHYDLSPANFSCLLRKRGCAMPCKRANWDWVIITMAMVDVDGSCQFSADSQPKSIALVWVLAATPRGQSMFIKWTAWTLAMTLVRMIAS